MANVGRNDPCPCGSGKKHKQCCLGKPGGGLAPARKRGLALPIIIAVVGIGAGVYLAMTRDSWTAALAAGGGGVMLAAVVASFRDPPPPTGNSSDGAAINFGT